MHGSRRASFTSEAEAARHFAGATRPARFRAHSEERGGGRDNACFEMSTSPPRRPADRYDATPPRKAPQPLVITYNWHENACFDGPKSPYEWERQRQREQVETARSRSVWEERREPPVGAAAAANAALPPCRRGEMRSVTSPTVRRRLLSSPPSPPPPSLPPPPPAPLPVASPTQRSSRRRQHHYTEIDSIAAGDLGEVSPPRGPQGFVSAERTPPLPPRCPRDLPYHTSSELPSIAPVHGSTRSLRSPRRHAASSSYCAIQLERQRMGPQLVQTVSPSSRRHAVSPPGSPYPSSRHVAERCSVTYLLPQQGGAGQPRGSTAVVAPLPVGRAVARAKQFVHRLTDDGDDAPPLKGKSAPLSAAGVSAPAAASALSALGIGLSATGTATFLIGMYLLVKEGRRYYLDFGLLAGVVALALALLAFRARRWDTPPNRNFLSGLTVSLALALLETALLGAAAAVRPTPGDAFADLLGGGVCGVAVLASALAAAAAAASCCGSRPPADNRVASAAEAPLAGLPHPAFAL